MFKYHSISTNQYQFVPFVNKLSINKKPFVFSIMSKKERKKVGDEKRMPFAAFCKLLPIPPFIL